MKQVIQKLCWSFRSSTPSPPVPFSPDTDDGYEDVPVADAGCSVTQDAMRKWHRIPSDSYVGAGRRRPLNEQHRTWRRRECDAAFAAPVVAVVSLAVAAGELWWQPSYIRG